MACPDVVGDHAATLALWRQWAPEIDSYGLPAAFVAQDGCTAATVPWETARAVFIGGKLVGGKRIGGRIIGGEDPYKLGLEAAGIVRAAKERGLWAHMGRVNTQRRIHYAGVTGCDSVDGSGFSKHPIEMLRKTARAIDSASRNLRLPLGREVSA